jgi:hypothetical protein
MTRKPFRPWCVAGSAFALISVTPSAVSSDKVRTCADPPAESMTTSVVAIANNLD